MNYRTSSVSKPLSILSNTLLSLTFLIIPLASSKIIKFPFQTPKILSLEFLIILLSLTVSLSIILKRKLQFTSNLFDLSVLLRFIFLLNLFSIKSDNSFSALNILLLLTIFYFLLRVIFTFNVTYISKIILNISRIFFVVAIIEILLIVYNQPFRILAFDNLLLSNKVLFRGTFGNPNWVSGYLVAVFPFLFLLILQSKTKFFKYFYTIGTLFILLFIIISQSRGAWVALVIGIIFYFFHSILSFIQSKRVNKILFCRTF